MSYPRSSLLAALAVLVVLVAKDAYPNPQLRVAEVPVTRQSFLLTLEQADADNNEVPLLVGWSRHEVSWRLGPPTEVSRMRPEAEHELWTYWRGNDRLVVDFWAGKVVGAWVNPFQTGTYRPPSVEP